MTPEEVARISQTVVDQIEWEVHNLAESVESFDPSVMIWNDSGYGYLLGHLYARCDITIPRAVRHLESVCRMVDEGLRGPLIDTVRALAVIVGGRVIENSIRCEPSWPLHDDTKIVFTCTVLVLKDGDSNDGTTSPKA